MEVARTTEGIDSRLHGVFWLALAGGVHFVLVPPHAEHGWFVLHPFVWVVPIAIFSRLTARRAFAAGWFLGTTANLFIFEWLVETLRRFTEIPIWAVYGCVLSYSLAAGLVAATFAVGVAPLRRCTGAAWPFAVAAWLVTCEHWIPQFFPYAQGAAWISVPQVFLLSAQTGIGGVSFLAFLVSGFLVILYESLRGQRPENIRATLSSAAVAGLTLVLALGVARNQEARISRAEREATPFRVAMVQDNLERLESFRRFKDDPRGIAERLVALSDAALRDAGRFDVVLWSEGALPSSPDRSWGEPARDFARRTGVEVWTGAITRTIENHEKRTYNSVYRIHDGTVSVPYHKNHLVPISEKMPLADRLPSLQRLTGAVPGSGLLDAGSEPGVFDTRWARVAFVICYEAILDEPMRASVAAGADLLANFTYEGWFGNTRELDLHLLMARGQVAQLGVPMVRAATTGITAVIDARGRVTRHAGRFTREVLVDEVKPLRAGGLYARVGPWFAWSCTGVCFALFLRNQLRPSHRNNDPMR